jgi:signal transduction histidine kinase
MSGSAIQISVVLLVGTLLSLMFVASVIIFVFLYQNRTIKHQQELHRKDEEKLVAGLQATIHSQELERKRISLELHDGLGLPLSALKLTLYEIAQHISPNSSAHSLIVSARETMNSIIIQTRDLSHNLLSGSLEQAGLQSALLELCEQSKKSTGRVFLFVNTGEYSRIDYNAELMIYRIVQELLQNIIKHADASNTEVNLINTPDSLEVTVKDDGVGFDTSSLHTTTGIGLSNIESRAHVLRAKFYIASAPDKGTIATMVYNKRNTYGDKVGNSG